MDIEIDGKKYKLIPIEEEGKVEKITTLYDKGKEPSPIRRAVPRLYGYRERFKKRQLLASDIVANPKRGPAIKNFDPDPGNSLSKSAGYNVWIGEGVAIDL